MLHRYSDDYDYQDAMRDKFEDSCEPCFCLSCSEESKCYYTDDDRLTYQLTDRLKFTALIGGGLIAFTALLIMGV